MILVSLLNELLLLLEESRYKVDNTYSFILSDVIDKIETIEGIIGEIEASISSSVINESVIEQIEYCISSLYEILEILIKLGLIEIVWRIIQIISLLIIRLLYIRLELLERMRIDEEKRRKLIEKLKNQALEEYEKLQKYIREVFESRKNKFDPGLGF